LRASLQDRTGYFPRETEMVAEYHCASCDETFREDTVEGVLKRAAAHNHDEHGGPASITPEVEAGLRANIREVAA
jgi:Protein of unknown function (DUF1059)